MSALEEELSAKLNAEKEKVRELERKLALCAYTPNVAGSDADIYMSYSASVPDWIIEAYSAIVLFFLTFAAFMIAIPFLCETLRLKPRRIRYRRGVVLRGPKT